MANLENQIFTGDCLVILKDMQDNCVDMTFTSPPYNANQRLSSSGKFVPLSPAEKDQCTKYTEFSDALSPQDYYEWSKKVLNECLRVTKGQVFWNIQMISPNKWAIAKLLGDFADQLKEVIIWDKGFGEPAIQEGVMNSVFEFIFVFDKNDAIHRSFQNANFARGTFNNIIRIGKNSGSKLIKNTACFPMDIPLTFIENFSKEGDTILDPMCGSGATCSAAKQLKRKYIGIEITPSYAEVAQERLKVQSNPLF